MLLSKIDLNQAVLLSLAEQTFHKNPNWVLIYGLDSTGSFRETAQSAASRKLSSGFQARSAVSAVK